MARRVRTIATAVGVLLMVASIGGVASAAPAPGRPAEVRLPATAAIGQGGELRLSVSVRCRSPLVVQELTVEVSQEPQTVGFAAGDFGIVCDGAWHAFSVGMFSAAGIFVGGDAVAHASFTVLDPDSFDPVDQAQDAEVVTIS